MAKRNEGGRANDDVVSTICIPANPEPEQTNGDCEDKAEADGEVDRVLVSFALRHIGMEWGPYGELVNC